MALVWTCPAGQASTTTANSGLGQTDTLGECSSGGQWVEASEIVQAGIDFQVANLDPQILAAAFGAGFVTLGTGLLIAWAGRIILSAVRSA